MWKCLSLCLIAEGPGQGPALPKPWSEKRRWLWGIIWTVPINCLALWGWGRKRVIVTIWTQPSFRTSFPTRLLCAPHPDDFPSPLTFVTLHMFFWNTLPFLVCALNVYSVFSIQMRFTSFWMPSVIYTSRPLSQHNIEFCPPHPPTAAYSAHC